MKRPHKILIFNVNWLGDVVFTTPFIRAVREASPGSHIACIVAPRCREVLETNTRIDELIVFDEKGREKTFLGKLRFAIRLRSKRFDSAFILHRSLTRALITFIAGIKERTGYDTKGRGFLLTKSVALRNRPAHKVEHFLALAAASGLNIPGRDYEFFITEKDEKHAEGILKAAGVHPCDSIAVLNPGGNWGPKRWPTDNFAGLADRLVEKYGVKVLITGSEKDRALADSIAKKMENKAISVCGKTGLRELASIFKKARVVVSGDSGPMHIAIGAGANVVSLFGPTSAGITGPYGKGSYAVIEKNIGCEVPCYKVGCADNKCMKAITPEDVLEVIDERGYLLG